MLERCSQKGNDGCVKRDMRVPKGLNSQVLVAHMRAEAPLLRVLEIVVAAGNTDDPIGEPVHVGCWRICTKLVVFFVALQAHPGQGAEVTPVKAILRDANSCCLALFQQRYILELGCKVIHSSAAEIGPLAASKPLRKTR